MSTVDTRVVEMRFDNRQFEQGVKQTQNSVNGLKKSLNFEDSGKSLKKLGETAENIDFDKMALSLESIKNRFSTLGIVGMNIINKLTDAGINLGKKLINAIEKPIDIAINNGRDRVAAIEDSKFQLKGLGIIWDEQKRAVNSYEEAVDGAVKLTEAHMTEAEKLAHKVTDSIADDIDYGVKDTAYGLGDAAKVAAQLSASGIQIGDGMREALRGISGVAAMTNSTYEDIGNIFTRIAGNGRVMGDDLLSISSRGMNAAASLANYFNSSEELMRQFSETYNSFKKKNQEAIDEATGATEQAVRELITNGGLDFRTFAAAMDAAFGEHAKEGNTTYAGSLANISSALARIGALFQGPLREQSIPLFNAIRTFINSVKPLFEPFANAFEKVITTISGGLVGALNKAEAAIEGFKKDSSGWNGWQPFKDGVAALGDSINFLFEIFGKAISDIFFKGKDTNSMLQQAAMWANNFATSMKNFYTAILNNSDKIRDIFKGFISFFRILGQIFGPILKGIGQLIAYFFGFDSTIFKASAGLGKLLTKLADSKVIFNAITKAVTVAVKVITGFFNIIRGTTKITIDFFKTLKKKWQERYDKPGFEEAWNGFKDRWSKHFAGMKRVGEAFKKFFSALWNALKPAFQRLGEMFSKGFDRILDGFADFGENLARLFKPGGYEGITGVVNFVSVLSTIVGMFTQLIPGFAKPFSTLGGLLRDISVLPAKLDAFFGGIAGVCNTYKKKLNVETVKEIGKTLLILAVALLIIASINQDELTKAFGVISLLLAELTGVMTVLMGFGKFGGVGASTKTNMFGLAAVFMGIGLAMFNIAIALKIISSIDGEELRNSVIALSIMLSAIAAVIGVLTALDSKLVNASKLNGVKFKARFAAIGFAIQEIAAAMFVLSLSIKILSTIEPERMVSAIIGFSAGLAALVVALMVLGSAMYGPKTSQGFDTKTGKEIFSRSKLTAGRMAGMAAALLILVPVMITLAVSVKLLSTIAPERMASALIGFAAGFAVLVIALKVLGSSMYGPNVSQGFNTKTGKEIFSKTKLTAGRMAGMAASLLILVPVMISLSASLKILSTIPIEKMGSAILGFAAGFAILVIALKVLGSSMYGPNVSQGFNTKTGKEIFSKTKLTAGRMAGMAAALLILVPTMIALSASLKIMSTISIDKMATAILGFAAGFAILVIALKVLGSSMYGPNVSQGFNTKTGKEIFSKTTTTAGRMAGMAASLLILAPTMLALAASIKILSTIDIKSMGTALLGFAAGFATLIAALLIMQNATNKINAKSEVSSGKGALQMVGLAGSLVLLATAALILAPALKIMGSVSWEGLAKGLISIAGALTIFIAAAYAVKNVPFMAIGKLALILVSLGAGIALIGAGFMMAGIGLINLTAGLTSFAGISSAMINQILTNFALLANRFLLILPTIIMNVLNVLAVLITGILDLIIKVAPKIGEALIVLINTLCDVLISTVPRLIDTGLTLLIALLEGIANNMQRIVAAGLAIIENFIRGLAEGIPGIIDAGLDFVVALIGGIGRGIQEHSAELGSAMGTLIGAMYKGLADGIASFWQTITPFVNDLETLQSEKIIKGAQAINTIFALIFSGTVLANVQKFFEFFGGVTVEKLGQSLATFGGYFAQFSDAVKNVNPEALQTTSSALDSFARVLVGIGVSGFNTFDFAIIGPEFALFGRYFADFAQSIRTLTVQDAVQTAILTAMMQAILSVNLPRHGGLIDWIIGSSTSYAYIGKDLSILAQNLLDLRQYVKDFVPKDAEQAKIMGEIMRALLEVNLPRQGGLAEAFAGNNSLETVGPQLVPFAKNIADYMDTLRKMNLGDQDKNNAEIMKEVMVALFGVKLPNQGGVAAFFAGENSLETIGPQITPFAVHMTHYLNEVRRMKLNEQDKTNAEIMKEVMVALFGVKLPNQGGVAAFFAGENSLEVIGPQITPFALHMTHYLDEVRRMNLSQQDVENQNIMDDVLVGLFGVKLPNEGGVAAFFAGDNNLGLIAPQLAMFGKGFAEYLTAIKGASLGDAKADSEAVVNAITTLFNADFSKAKVDIGKGIFAGGAMSELQMAASQMPSLGAGIKGFYDCIKGINTSGYNLPDIINMIIAVTQLAADGQKNYADIGKDIESLGKGVEKFSESIKKINGDTSFTDDFENILKELIRICEENREGLHDSGNSLIASFISGFTHYDGRDAGVTITQYITSALSDVSDILNKYAGPFSEDGKKLVSELIEQFKFLETALKEFHADTEALTNSEEITSNFEKMLKDLVDLSNTYRDSIHSTGNDIMSSFISGFTHMDGQDSGFVLSQYIKDSLSEVTLVLDRYSGAFSQSGQELVSQLVVEFKNLEEEMRKFHEDTEALTDTNGVTNNFEAMLKDMVDIATNYKGTIHANGDDLISSFISGFTHYDGRDSGFTIVTYFTNALSETLENIKSYSGPFNEGGKDLCNRLVQSFQELEEAMQQFHTDTEELAGSGDISTNFEQMLKDMVELSDTYRESIHVSGENLISSYISSLTHYNGRDTNFTIVSYFSSTMSDCVKEIDSFQNSARTAGANFVEGLKQGMQSKSNELVNVVNSLASISIKTTMEVLDEHSPSKVMYKLGAYAMEGFINGMADQEGMLGEVVETMAEAVTAIGGLTDDQFGVVSNETEPLIAMVAALKGVTAGTAEYDEIVNKVAKSSMAFAGSLYAASDQYATDREEIVKLQTELVKLQEEYDKASKKYEEATSKAEYETGKAAEFMQSKWDAADEAIGQLGGSLGQAISDNLRAYMATMDTYDSMEEGVDKLAFKDVVDGYKETLDALIDSIDDSTDAGKAFKEMLKKVVDGLINARSETNSLLKEFNDNVKEAEETTADAADSIAEKQDEIEEKTKEMFENIVDYWKDFINKIKDAVKSYTNIFSGTKTSIDIFAQREEKDNSEAENYAKSQKEAADGVTDAEKDLSSAKKELADAEKDLADAKARSEAVNGKSLIALNQIEDAENRIAEAKEKVAEAEQKVSEAQQKSLEAAQEMAEYQRKQTPEYAAEEMIKNMQASMQKYSDYESNIKLLTDMEFTGSTEEYIKELIRGGYDNAEQIASIVKAVTSKLGPSVIEEMTKALDKKQQIESETYRESIINKMKETQEWSNKITYLQSKGLNKDLVQEMIDQGPDNSDLVNMIYNDMKRDGEDAIKYWNDLYGGIETNANNVSLAITTAVSGLAEAVGLNAQAIVSAILQSNAGNAALNLDDRAIQTLIGKDIDIQKLWNDTYHANYSITDPADFSKEKSAAAWQKANEAVNIEVNRKNKETNGAYGIQYGLIDVQALTQSFTQGAQEYTKAMSGENANTVTTAVAQTAASTAETVSTALATVATEQIVPTITENQTQSFEELGKLLDTLSKVYTRMLVVKAAIVTAIAEHLNESQLGITTASTMITESIIALNATLTAATNFLATAIAMAVQQVYQTGYFRGYDRGFSDGASAASPGGTVRGPEIQRTSSSLKQANFAGTAVGKAYGKGIADGTKSSLGIKSPSKVFMAIGKFVDLGFAQGVRDNTPKVAAALSALTKIDTDSINSLLDFSGIQNGNLLDLSTTRAMASGINPNTTTKLEDAIRALTAQQPAAGVTDNSTQNNTFNITGSDPREIANQVNVILQKKAVRRRESWA